MSNPKSTVGGYVEGVNHIEGNLSAEGRSFGIVASRFNDFVVKALLEGAIEAIRRHGATRGRRRRLGARFLRDTGRRQRAGPIGTLRRCRSAWGP